MQHYGLTCLTGSMFSCDCHHKYEGTVAMLCRLTAFSIVKICSTCLVRNKHGTYHHTTELRFVFLIKKWNQVNKLVQWGQMDFANYVTFWRLWHTQNIVTVIKYKRI
jgi:hypothetical protein